MLFLRKKNSVTVETEELSERLCNFEEKQRFLLVAIRAILAFIKDFSLDVKEINAEGFKKKIDDLIEKFRSEEKTKSLQSFFETQKQTIRSYTKRQNEYLREKENELKDIINVLTKAMATFDVENEKYNQKIYEQSEKMEQITLLDDIREIKNTLKREVEQIREADREKQANDRSQIDMLSGQVSFLKVELENAKKVWEDRKKEAISLGIT